MAQTTINVNGESLISSSISPGRRFLHCAAGLDKPTSGAVLLGDVDLTTLKEPILTKLRRERVGFISQAVNLLTSLTVWQNVILPERLARKRPNKSHARGVIDRVGLTQQLNRRPAALSGGQQQRGARPLRPPHPL